MKQGKSAYNPKHAWMTAAAVLGVSLFFGAFVMPYFKPAGSKMVGLPAPDFALPVLVNGEPGNRLRLSEQKGRAVILDFWASWCAPCRAQAPILDRVAKAQDPSRVLVLGVNTKDDQGDALRFARAAGISYASVHDAGGRVADSFGIRELPTLVIVDRAGNVTAVRSRVVKEGEIKNLLAKALAASTQEAS